MLTARGFHITVDRLNDNVAIDWDFQSFLQLLDLQSRVVEFLTLDFNMQVPLSSKLGERNYADW